MAVVVKNSPANTGRHNRQGFDPWVGLLEEGMAHTPASILAWRIPRTEELGGPESIGLQRVDMTELT